jgi:hypothetical protein
MSSVRWLGNDDYSKLSQRDSFVNQRERKHIAYLLYSLREYRLGRSLERDEEVVRRLVGR